MSTESSEVFTLTERSGLVVLAAMILKYRSQLMKFLRRRTSQDNQPSVSEVSKPPDLEGNATGGYLPHDVPAYVSRSIFLVSL